MHVAFVRTDKYFPLTVCCMLNNRRNIKNDLLRQFKKKNNEIKHTQKESEPTFFHFVIRKLTRLKVWSQRPADIVFCIATAC